MPETAPINHDAAGIDGRTDGHSRQRDLVTLGIVISAILLFVSTGAKVIPQALTYLSGTGPAPESSLVTALILNIALILFGWSRHNDLAQEISGSRKLEQRALVLAETDPLTGCMNRRGSMPAIARKVGRVSSAQDRLAVIVIDIDNFKHINDVKGHLAGDSTLSTLAKRFADLLPTDAVLARIGGDEFACAWNYKTNDGGTADSLVKKLIAASNIPIAGPDCTINTTVSIGGVLLDVEGKLGDALPQATQLLHHADIAMYFAKSQGKNQFAWFERSMARERKFRSELERGIRSGISRGEFVPFYQQQIELETGKLTGFEMLARWYSPKLGNVSPEIFIPIAEEIGAISALSEVLIEQALEDAKHWASNLTLSVNVSPVQLRDEWFAQKLLGMLSKAKFPPNRLDIEITESCLHENLATVQTVITSLRNQGVQVSLDDFGTGYASIAQLKELPFDRIKIDRSFVSGLAKRPNDNKIVEAIVKLGQGLKLPVTAEGIESEGTLSRLREYGDIKGQGFLYGQPADAAETRKILAAASMLRQNSSPTTRAPSGTARDAQVSDHASDTALPKRKSQN